MFRATKGNTDQVIAAYAGRDPGSIFSTHSSLFGRLADLGLVGQLFSIELQAAAFVQLTQARRVCRALRWCGRGDLVSGIMTAYILSVIHWRLLGADHDHQPFDRASRETRGRCGRPSGS